MTALFWGSFRPSNMEDGLIGITLLANLRSSRYYFLF
jgi:hypothetical protein